MNLHIRPFTEEDLAFADSLRALAGWNQTIADWRRFLATDADGCFVAELDGLPVGTATTTTYGPATTTIVEPSSSCSCGSHASSAPVGTGALVGNPTSTYSNGGSTISGNSYPSGSTVPADSRPTLSGNEAPRIDGNSLERPRSHSDVR